MNPIEYLTRPKSAGFRLLMIPLGVFAGVTLKSDLITWIGLFVGFGIWAILHIQTRRRLSKDEKWEKVIGDKSA